MSVEIVKKFLKRSGMQFVTIYSDGSGCIIDHCEDEVADFDNTEEMYSTMLDMLGGGNLSAEERLKNMLEKCDD